MFLAYNVMVYLLFGGFRFQFVVHVYYVHICIVLHIPQWHASINTLLVATKCNNYITNLSDIHKKLTSKKYSVPLIICCTFANVLANYIGSAISLLNINQSLQKVLDILPTNYIYHFLVIHENNLIIILPQFN